MEEVSKHPDEWRGSAKDWAASLSDYELGYYANSPHATIRYLALALLDARSKLRERDREILDYHNTIRLLREDRHESNP